MRLKLLAIVVLVVVGAGALYVSFGGLPASADTTRYLTAVAAVGDVTDEVAATGAVASAETWGLAFGASPHLVTDASSDPPASGASVTVKSVAVAVGQAVKKGQVLATADTTTLSRELNEKLRSLRISRIQLANAQDDMDSANSSGRTVAIRQATIGLYNAQNQEAQAKQAYLDALAARDSSRRITAPADGIVTAVSITAGQSTPSGDAITIAATAYQVTADVTESDITKIKAGQTANVTIAAVDGAAQGTVSAIAPTASSSSSSGSGGVVSYAVTITLAQLPAGIKPGMTTDITITIASSPNVLWVPAAAVSGTSGDYVVRTLSSTGTVEVKPIQVGLITDSRVEVTSGLNEGDTVIIGTATTQQQSTVTNGPGGGLVIPGGGGFGGGRDGGGRNFQRPGG